MYLLPPFVFISLASWAYDHNLFNYMSCLCALNRLSMSRVSNCELGKLKAFKVVLPSQLELVLLLLQQHSQVMVQTPHVSTIADLENQKFHQYFQGLSHISMSLVQWHPTNLYNRVYLYVNVLLELSGLSHQSLS